MSLQDRIKEKIRTRKRKLIKLFGEDVVILLQPASVIQSEIIDKREKDDESGVMKFLASQFIDPETDEPIFSFDVLDKDMSNYDLQELMTVYMKYNMKNAEKTELDIEKN